MAQSRSCPKCSGTMIQGFIVDQAHGGAATVPAWVEGAPERSVWTGVRLGGKPRLDVETWRCRGCGFLEQYAAGGPSRRAEAHKRAQRAVLTVALAAAAFLALLAGVLVLVAP